MFPTVTLLYFTAWSDQSWRSPNVWSHRTVPKIGPAVRLSVNGDPFSFIRRCLAHLNTPEGDEETASPSTSTDSFCSGVSPLSLLVMKLFSIRGRPAIDKNLELTLRGN